jgi:DNA repair protein RecO (recombination protein O)
MQIKHTLGVVLTRTNFAENDRIVTFITHDFGKIKAIARGARKERSKMAGGIELFSISHIGFIIGKGELATLVSTRLVKHYDNFLSDLEKVNFAYDCHKKINKIMADGADKNYFLLLEQLLEALNNLELPLPVIAVWWYCNLAKLTGHNINTEQIIGGGIFKEGNTYIFDTENGGFREFEDGSIKPDHIKYLRIATNNSVKVLAKVRDGQKIAEELLPALRGFIEYTY